MNNPTDEMVDKVFKRTEGADQKLDTHVFNVLMAIDGKRSVGTIAREDLYDMKDLTAVIEQLVNKGAIVPVLTNEPLRSRDAFFSDLEKQLNRIMGPVGSIVLQDNVTDLGYDVPNFPMIKAHALIELMSRSIPNRAEAEAFSKSMNDSLNLKE